MIICIGDLLDVNPLFTQDLMEKAITCKPIKDKLYFGKFLVDEFNPKDIYTINTYTIAMRIFELHLEDTKLFADMDLLENTFYGLLLKDNFPNNVRFILKALHRPAVANSKGVIVQDPTLQLLGISYQIK